MQVTSTLSFSERFQLVARKRSPFCLGLDPTPTLLKQWQLPDSLSGLEEFSARVLPACAQVAIVKPQYAFYERFGPAGLAHLQTMIRQIQAEGTLVLLDAKKGDISHTLTAYVEACLGPSSAYQADALTLTAYLGIDAMQEAITHAHTTQTGLFIVVRSSNHEGQQLQQAKMDDGTTVAEDLALKITSYNKQSLTTTAPGAIGAVLGATVPAPELASLIQKMPFSLFLTPGLGAQGASVADIATAFADVTDRVIPTSSRAVLREGPELNKILTAIETLQEQCAASLC